MEGRGYTLMEALITLGILSILAVALGATLPSTMASWSVRAAAEEIRSVLRLARAKAVHTFREYRVRFDAVDDTYCLEQGNRASRSTAWTPQGPCRKLPERVDLYKITMFKDKGVIFNTNGTVEGVNGAVYLEGRNGERFRVRILSATGNIVIQPESQW